MGKPHQTEFIRRIKNALGHSIPDPQRMATVFYLPMSQDDKAIMARIKNREPLQKENLFDILVAAAKPINANIVALPDELSARQAIVDLVRTKQPEWGDNKSVVVWKHPLIDALNLSEALREINVPVHVAALNCGAGTNLVLQTASEHIRRQVINSYIGITSADFCMADTATLVLRTRPGQARSVSLVPSIHIAVIYRDQIIADLKELFVLLKWHPEHQKDGLTNCMTFISGPSKTADIEATMVHGAHGPREVYVYVLCAHSAT